MTDGVTVGDSSSAECSVVAARTPTVVLLGHDG
jgi:hypothetical protein